MIIDSLLVALGFDVDKEGIAEFEKRVEEARETVTTLVTAVGAMAAAVGAFVYSVADNIDELGDFAELNQVTVAGLEELGYAAEMNGASLDAVKSSVQGLNSVMGQVLNGVGRGAKMFEQFGFKVKNADGTVKTFDQMLGEVADRMAGMDRKAAMAMAEKLGIDASLVPMLQKGSKEIEKLRAEAQAFGVTSEDNAQAASNFMDALAGIRFLARALANALAFEIMPRVTAVIDRFKAWYMANRDIIKQRLEVALGLITSALGILWDAFYAVTSMVFSVVNALSRFRVVVWASVAAISALVAIQIGKYFHALNILLTGAITKMMAFNFAALLIPMAIGAVILALGLLIEDFMVFRRGGESVIGDLVKKFPELAGVIDAIGSTVDSVVAWFKAQWATLAGPLAESGGHLMKLAGILMSVLWPVAKFVFGMIGRVISFLLPIIVSVVGWVLELAVLMAGGLVEAFNIAATAIEFVADKISAFIDGVKDAIDWVARLLGLSGGTTELEVKKTEKGASVATGQQANPAERAPIALAQPPMLEMISQSPAMTGQQQAPAGFGPRAPAGTMGAVNTSTVQNTTTNLTTNVAKIEIVSTDPAKAGESVKRELDRTNKTGIRNGQAGYL